MSRRVSRTHEGEPFRLSFDSLDALADFVDKSDEFHARSDYRRKDFCGVSSAREAVQLAREGWSAELEGALTVAEDAIAKVETEHTLTTFVPTFDVQGCDVDISRYLSGEPENMIDYPLVPIVKAGRVITLCASMSISGSIDAATVTRRGQVIAALAIALSRLGYATEIWADLTGSGYTDGKRMAMRVLVKSAHDVIDPERILFAMAHPAMLRVLGFAAIRTLPESAGEAREPSYITPCDPEHDLPDGTIYLPCLRSDRDIPDADRMLTDYLRELDILPAE